jgi:hypothetical protein
MNYDIFWPVACALSLLATPIIVLARNKIAFGGILYIMGVILIQHLRKHSTCAIPYGTIMNHIVIAVTMLALQDMALTKAFEEGGDVMAVFDNPEIMMILFIVNSFVFSPTFLHGALTYGVIYIASSTSMLMRARIASPSYDESTFISNLVKLLVMRCILFCLINLAGYFVKLADVARFFDKVTERINAAQTEAILNA